MHGRIISKLYIPTPWEERSDQLKNSLLECQFGLEKISKGANPTYNQLSLFSASLDQEFLIRKEIREWTEQRSRVSYSIHQESASLNLFHETYSTASTARWKSLQELAKAVYKSSMGVEPPQRTQNLSIIYLPWLKFPEVGESDPINWYFPMEHEPWIYKAIQTFLVVITAHPFTDGNGRVGRMIFNLFASPHVSNKYVPISEIFRSTQGGFEERLARAAIDGDYEDLFIYISHVFLEYSRYVEELGLQDSELDHFDAIANQIWLEKSGEQKKTQNLQYLPFTMPYRCLIETQNKNINLKLVNVFFLQLRKSHLLRTFLLL